jgi:hypothetical protein
MNNFIEQQMQIVSTVFTEKGNALARDHRRLTQTRLDQIETEIILKLDAMKTELAAGDHKATLSQQMLLVGDVTKTLREKVSSL